MANHGGAGGPSLLQARSMRPTPEHGHHHHHHRHLDRNHHHLLHLHQHGRLQPAEDGTAPPHIRLPPNKKQLHGRQVVIVQTVSVVHYVDAAGAVTSVKTLTSDPAALTSPALPAISTAGSGAAGDASPSVSFSGLLADPTDGAPSTSSAPLSEPETTDSVSAPTSVVSTPSEILTLITSTDSTSDSSTLTLTDASSTRFHSFISNHTVALFSNSTRTSSSSTRSRFTSSSTRTSALWTSTTTTSAIETAVVGAPENGDSGTNIGAGIQSPIPAPVEPSSDPSPGLPPQTRNAVVGGVVGSVAGIALIVVALMYLLKWRRHRGQGIMLLADGDSAVRPRSSMAGSGELATRRSGAFSVQAALAKLNSWRMSITPGAGSEPAPQEKGFYRVSGRKLISVLESGGDGYSDPLDYTPGGAQPALYRDSQASMHIPNQPPLKLGSPMRPESGVPIFRDGPQRTAIAEQPPLSAQRRSAFPTTIPVRDSIGRTLVSRNGSRGSGSRFMEGT